MKALFPSGIARAHIPACALSATTLLVTGMAHHPTGTARVTQITYDAGNHITSVTGPRGLVTTYTYDGLPLCHASCPLH